MKSYGRPRFFLNNKHYTSHAVEATASRLISFFGFSQSTKNEKWEMKDLPKGITQEAKTRLPKFFSKSTDEDLLFFE